MGYSMRDYVDTLFARAPKTERITQLKDELICRMTACYEELLASGKTEQEAFKSVTDQVGNINELILGIEESAATDESDLNAWHKKSAKIVSLSVILYILSVASVMVFELIAPVKALGPIVMFVFVAIATGMLIYHFMSKPRFVRIDPTIVDMDSYKTWAEKKDNRKEIEDAVSSIIWTITIAVYFIMSFWLGNWGTSWIIFIIGAAVQAVASLKFKVK